MSNVSVFRVVSCNGPQRFTSGSLYTSLYRCWRKSQLQKSRTTLGRWTMDALTNSYTDSINTLEIKLHL